jgi:hypothetical protein
MSLNKKQIFDLLEEPKGEIYRRLIDFAISCHSIALLVVQPEMSLSARGQELLSALQPFQLEAARSSSWPGTELLDSEAVVYYFRLLPESGKVLQDAVPSLYAWLQPEIPEDLCFLSEDREPWLVTISHERDGYLCLDEGERQRLVRALPDLRLAPLREEVE